MNEWREEEEGEATTTDDDGLVQRGKRKEKEKGFRRAKQEENCGSERDQRPRAR